MTACEKENIHIFYSHFGWYSCLEYRTGIHRKFTGDEGETTVRYFATYLFIITALAGELFFIRIMSFKSQDTARKPNIEYTQA